MLELDCISGLYPYQKLINYTIQNIHRNVTNVQHFLFSNNLVLNRWKTIDAQNASYKNEDNITVSISCAQSAQVDHQSKTENTDGIHAINKYENLKNPFTIINGHPFSIIIL